VADVVSEQAPRERAGEPALARRRPTPNVRKLNEISQHVQGQYALPNGRKLVLVLSTPLEVQSQGTPVPIRAIGVSSGLPGETAQDAAFYDASTAWAYNLCGVGSKCAVPGRPSVARFDLLRREALELSLYTFKYESAVEAVITYMPPTTGAIQETAVFLRREDVAKALKAPLAHTLTPIKRTLRPGRMTRRDLASVRHYTNTHVYQYRFQPLQDGTPVLLLAPLRG
jgi:hypothetical protein